MNNIPNLRHAHIRIARPTQDLSRVIDFYRDGLGFEILYQFQDHTGFDGVMLGHKGAPYHLEFTRHTSHSSAPPPSPDHLLVFYLPETALWQSAIDHLQRLGHHPVKSFNPYWDKSGRTFEDPDGYRIILQNTPGP